MLFRSTLLALASVASFATSQTVDPETVDEGTKAQWCLAQQTSCPLLCLQMDDTTSVPKHNDCDDETLVFSCVCSNNKEPNATEYSQTIPYFLCTESNNVCVENCDGDTTCQTSCREDNPCGAQDPPRVNTTTAPTGSATGSATATGSGGDVVYTGFGDGSASNSEPGDGAGAHAAVEIGRVYGFSILAAGFVGGFALLL
ncbi:hypothetical protein FQN54_003381 [Arachnomyces sp. PD_36]|nr:hypothetical protein FQN54_003381 [Arachnomyces sp. PD_36]